MNTKEITRLIKRRAVLEQERDRNRRRNSMLFEQMRGIQDVLGGGSMEGSGDGKWICMEIGLSQYLALYPKANANHFEWVEPEGNVHHFMLYENQFALQMGETAIWVNARTAEQVVPKAQPVAQAA